MPDGWEVEHSLNPLIDDSQDDADEDGLTNLQEYNHGTDPQNPDTDGDGYNDWEEIKKGTNPIDPEDYPSNFGGIVPILGGSVLLIGTGITIFILWKKGKIFVKKQ